MFRQHFSSSGRAESNSRLWHEILKILRKSSKEAADSWNATRESGSIGYSSCRHVALSLRPALHRRSVESWPVPAGDMGSRSPDREVPHFHSRHSSAPSRFLAMSAMAQAILPIAAGQAAAPTRAVVAAAPGFPDTDIQFNLQSLMSVLRDRNHEGWVLAAYPDPNTGLPLIGAGFSLNVAASEPPAVRPAQPQSVPGALVGPVMAGGRARPRTIASDPRRVRPQYGCMGNQRLSPQDSAPAPCGRN